MQGYRLIPLGSGGLGLYRLLENGTVEEKPVLQGTIEEVEIELEQQDWLVGGEEGEVRSANRDWRVGFILGVVVGAQLGFLLSWVLWFG